MMRMGLKVFEDVNLSAQAETRQLEGPAKALYATPGPNALSMIIEAATITKQVHLGKAYWDLVVNPGKSFTVQPDVQNISAYLRLLRISRSSKIALDVLRYDWPEEMKDKLYTRGNFVIAMSTCVRDKNNPNVFKMADRILDIMQERKPTATANELSERRRKLQKPNPRLSAEIRTMMRSSKERSLSSTRR